MPLVQPLQNGQPFGGPFTVTDASRYVDDPNYTVSADAGSSSTGIGYSPLITQQQWADEFARQTAEGQANAATQQFNAQTGRLNAATNQYGAQTTRAGTIGQLYGSFFGTPANYAATANLMRGQPNAAPLSFYGALGNLGPLGSSPNFADMQTLDAGKTVAGLFGASGGGGGGSGGGGSGGGGGDKSDIKWKRDYHKAVKEAGFGTGSAAREAANASVGMGEAAAAHEIKHHRNPYKGGAGLAKGGSVLVDHPAEIVFASGRRIPIGEYGRPERIDVTPLSEGPPPPRYYQGLASKMALAGVEPGPYRGVPPGPAMLPLGLTPNGSLPSAYPAYSGPPIPDTPYIVSRMGGLGGGAQGGWSGNYGPESEQPSLSPIGTVPLGRPFPPSGMAEGGSVVYGTPRQPSVMYPHGTVTQATSAPNAWGQVTAPSAQGGGHTVNVPYYSAMPFADPTTADPRVVRRLTPLELGLLEATSKAQHGLDLSSWMALYQNAQPQFQNASTSGGFTRAW